MQGIRFTVVVPAFQRKHALRECLAGLARLDYPRSAFEVVVVDDGSSSPPHEEVFAFSDAMSVRLVELRENWGPATARNAGAEEARGEYLAFIDDDCVPHVRWLSEIDARLHEFPRALVGGALRNGAQRNLCAEASQQLVDYLYGYFDADHNDARWFTSANIACPRTEYLGIGGFDPDFPLAAAEDRDFCDRWSEAGYRLIVAPKAIVDHVRPMTIAGFWEQHHRYGRGAHHLHRARVRRGVGLPRLEPLLFYGRLVAAPFRKGAGWRAPVLSLLLLVSQLAYAVGYFPERRRAPLQRRRPVNAIRLGDGTGAVAVSRAVRIVRSALVEAGPQVTAAADPTELA